MAIAKRIDFVTKSKIKKQSSIKKGCFYYLLLLFATRTSFTVSRTLFALRAGSGKHRPRIIPQGGYAAVGAFNFFSMRFYKLVKAFSARRTFILQKRHLFSPSFLDLFRSTDSYLVRHSNEQNGNQRR